MTKKNVPIQFGKNKFIDRDGYVLVRMPKNEDEKFKPMYKFKNMGYEHRLTMAKKMDRPLDRHEHVNHIDRNRKNNLITNLELINALEHLQQHRNEGHFKLFTSTYNPSLKEKKVKLDTLSKIHPKHLAAGILSESEHKDTVGNSPSIFAGIALDHLKEDPKYYTKLKKMEKKTILQKNAAGLTSVIGKTIGASKGLGGAAAKGLTSAGSLATKTFSPNVAGKITSGIGKVTSFASKNPKQFSSIVGGVGGAAIGTGIGALKDPGTDEDGKKKSRLQNAVTGGAIGGLAGAVAGQTKVMGTSFSKGFNKNVPVPKSGSILSGLSKKPVGGRSPII